MMKIPGMLKKSLLQSDNRENIILTEGRDVLMEYGFSEEDIGHYAKRVTEVLNDYAKHFGENTAVEYGILKRLGRLEIIVFIPGERFDPFEHGEDSGWRRLEKLFTLNVGSQVSCINYRYLMGQNIVIGSVPLNHKKKSILKNPYLWSILLGVITGMICLHLPEDAHQIIVTDILEHVYNILVKVLSGVMGPAIFISLITSIISMDSVSELTDLGYKILRRCVRIILFVTLISLVISLLFFNNFGNGGTDFSPSQIISMVLDIIPVNFVKPFLENNIPQIVILAFVSGLALLLLGENTKELNSLVSQINLWFMSIIKVIYYAMPALPFLSISVAIGNGNAGVLAKGWKFIAASYLIFTFCFVFKMIKTRIVTGMSSMEILQKSKSAIVMGFATETTTAPMGQIYEISKNKLHIKPEFSSLWVPMSTAMMSLKTTVNVVLATVMVAYLQETPISLSFLFVLIILTLEMSLASPGTVGSWVVAFEAFSMPSSYVGMFSTYRILTANYATAVVVAYEMLEQTEAAYRMNAIDAAENPAALKAKEG